MELSEEALSALVRVRWHTTSKASRRTYYQIDELEHSDSEASEGFPAADGGLRLVRSWLALVSLISGLKLGEGPSELYGYVIVFLVRVH